MCNIAEVLQTPDRAVRLSVDDRWMVWYDWMGETEQQWMVFERRPRARHTSTIIETPDLDKALAALMGGT